MSHRMHIDQSMKLIGKLLFGITRGPEVLSTVRPAGQPLVDDWKCLKSLVKINLFVNFALGCRNSQNHPLHISRLPRVLSDYFKYTSFNIFHSHWIVQVRTFETHCGSLSQYGMKHMRSLANFCNAGINAEQMAEASAQACPNIPAGPWSSLHQGFSA